MNNTYTEGSKLNSKQKNTNQEYKTLAD